MKNLFVLLFIFSGFHLFAGKYTITIKVNGMPQSAILLTDFYGDKNSIMDTAKTDANGIAVFSLPENQHQGMYKLVLQNDKYVDFLFNKENVSLETTISDVKSALKIIDSKENSVYFSFIHLQETTKKKMDVLQYAMDNYPQSEPFLQQIIAEYNKERDSYYLSIKKLTTENPSSYAAKLIVAKTELYPDISLNQFSRIGYKRAHWFDKINFADSSLFYTNILTDKAISFLGLFANKYYSPEQQTSLLKVAIDTIMMKSKITKKSYDFMINFMINGFEQMGKDKLVDYIATKYTEEQTCEHEGVKTTLERKILTHTKLIEGSDAPAFSGVSDKGVSVSLDNYANKTCMLVFWATWCPHCQQNLPEIKKIYDKRIDKSFDLITISLDSNKTDWKSYITDLNFNTNINICSGKGWDDVNAANYDVYATPSIFIIKNKKIIGKPYDLESLQILLKEQKIIGE